MGADDRTLGRTEKMASKKNNKAEKILEPTVIALSRALIPEFLKATCPGLGVVFALGAAYKDERMSSNIEKLVRELKARVDNIEQCFNDLKDGVLAEKIMQLILQATQESNEDKISFFAGVIAGELLHKKWDWDEELRNEFEHIILQLSGPEMIILKAMHDRKPNESLKLSPKGSHWLIPQITCDATTKAWIDSLIRKGLVEDASLEQIQTGQGGSGPNTVKSRSAFRLSIFARSMIDYLLKVQSKP
jgi:hypothetical protein